MRTCVRKNTQTSKLSSGQVYISHFATTLSVGRDVHRRMNLKNHEVIYKRNPPAFFLSPHMERRDRYWQPADTLCLSTFLPRPSACSPFRLSTCLSACLHCRPACLLIVGPVYSSLQSRISLIVPYILSILNPPPFSHEFGTTNSLHPAARLSNC